MIHRAAPIVAVVVAAVVVVVATGVRADSAPPPPMHWDPVVVTAIKASKGDASNFIYTDPPYWCVDGDGVGASVTLSFDRAVPIDRVGLPAFPPFEEHEDFRRPVEVEVANDAHATGTAKLSPYQVSDIVMESFDNAPLDGSPTKTLTITIKAVKPGAQKRMCFSGVTIFTAAGPVDLLAGVDAKAVASVTTSFAAFLAALSSCDAAKLAEVSAFPLEHRRYVARAAGKPRSSTLKTDVADGAKFAELCRGYNGSDRFPTTSRKPLHFVSEKPGELTMMGRGAEKGDIGWAIVARYVDGAWRIKRVTR